MPPDQITVPAVLPPYPDLVMRRINPSPDVRQQVTSAIEACTKWQRQSVQAAKGDVPPAQFTTEAQVCDVLDRWPLLYNGQELQAVSLGVGLAIATAVACMIPWAVFRGALGIVPLAPLASRFVARAVGGALCGVGLATFSLLLSLQEFVTLTPGQTADKAFLSWAGTASWAAAVFAVLFMLSEVPSAWRRWASPTATR